MFNDDHLASLDDDLIDNTPSNPDQPFDPYCGKFAWEIDEVRYWAWEDLIDQGTDQQNNPVEVPGVPSKMTNEQINEWVKNSEGTYNPANGHFACNDCYIRIGMPSGPRGWSAP